MKNIYYVLWFLFVFVMAMWSLPACKTYWATYADEGKFANFVTWMKSHGYSDQIIQIYRCNYANPALRQVLHDYFLIREGHLRIPADSYKGNRLFRKKGPLAINFVEVIPTDQGAGFVQIDPAMLKLLEKYLNNTFGREIKFNRIERRIDYHKFLGNKAYDYYALFPSNGSCAVELTDFAKNFEQPCIIRFDAEYLQGKEVPSGWESSHCAIFMGKQYRVFSSIWTFDSYAHELGHAFGLDHQFVDPRNPPRGALTRDLLDRFKGQDLGVDDVMIKSSPPKNPQRGRMLSPLSRYVLEPAGGYIDEKTMAATYQSAFNMSILEKIRNQACLRNASNIADINTNRFNVSCQMLFK